MCRSMAREEANSETATGGDYDVFLSFRGPDTRNTFTDCLYVFMRKAGIRIFRDDEELRPGEKISEILRAVENSHIYIPIFSRNYASSKWCLRELTRMVESYGQSPDKQILPIFYDVDPWDVKLETELYRSALTKHEEDLGCIEVEPWKEALTTVARIKGWHMKDQRQGEVIDDVIKKVSQMIIIRKRDLPTYLVGIDDRIEDIEKLLNYGDIGDVRFVIIHGMGGIGKTTLAKAIFNELFSGFEGHSFLSNIPESSPCHGIVKMQRKLVADLFNFSLPETFDFEDVNNMIRNRLPNKQVLLVFDGMDENDQFMQLAKHCTSCGRGSRIIITTRDKCVFPKIKAEGLEENILTGYRKIFLYEMKEMHFDHALQLFKKLAINTDSALFDLYDLSREAVALTGRLPLAIEVIGSHLRTISKAKWKSTLKKLKEIPHEEVQQKLKISYDALGYETKQIFLDIACFFVNKKITDAMYMWEACDLFPEIEIDVLINKSLIKIVDRDRIWIHDQLRDLGREIVRQESIGKPGDRSRLWFLKMALNIVQAKKGTENVVALTLWRSSHNFTREDFANLINTRFLELDGGNFTGNFEDILPELRWLCWQNCPPKLQANNFVLNHLVVLKLSGNIIIEEWSGWVEMMVPSKLKVLHLVGSKSLIKTPPFYELISLERLILKDFPKLAEIDPSVGKLERLIYLKIKWCPHLRGLPKEIGCLTTLRELILVHCFSVRDLPESTCYLKHLSRLVMENTRLVKLPLAIEKLVALEYMSLVNCTSLNGLPDAVGKLGCLTELDLSGTTIKGLPYSIWDREDLTVQTNSCNIRTPRRLEDEEVCIPRRIMLRYDALKYEAGQIFLDIICFFVDKKITNAMYMWKACEFFPEIQIDVLINKSLITKVDRDRIWINDEWRDVRREIFCQESICKSGDRSKLCFFEMARDIVEAKKGTENVVALTMCTSRRNFTREDFANLKNVRFLESDGGNFVGNFENILPQLKWLCWRNCPPKLQANNFVLNHVVVLKLSGHITTEGWSGWVKIMVVSKLKVLNLARSKSLIKTPCFSEFMSLERLILKDFQSLAKIDRSIGKLERLIYLKIKWCPCLRELPEEIGCLIALRELILI
ncbi:disease resistance protein RUN1 isoform X2 [Eucalyptus grandis]|uniref:disease resistance protein RUN1 isoform X2 n=1 Tax=Eucalyptus grandis TaxID=71139 RepID=UPI00192ED16A|nr:disease resistance protein RUN1 isoform X2 [Eucalyptus grandis]